MLQIREEQLRKLQQVLAAGSPKAVAEKLAAAGVPAAFDPATRTVAVADKRGHKTKVVFNADGAMTAVVRPSGLTTQVEADPVGPVRAVRLPSGDRIAYTRDAAGRTNSVAGPGGTTYRVEWDAKDRPLTHLFPDGKSNKYRYDDANGGYLAAWTDRGGATTRYEYAAGRTTVTDPLGRKLVYHTRQDTAVERTTYPDGTFEAFENDATKGGVRVTLRDGSTVWHQFDKKGNPSRSEWSDGRWLAMEFGDDGLTKVANDAGEVVLERGPGGRILAETTAAGRVEFAYDPDGRLESLTTPRGGKTAYAYDPDGRLEAITAWGRFAVRLAYGPDGGLQEIHYPNGVVERRNYDRPGLLTGVAWANARGDALGSQGYTYDSCERIVRVADTWGRGPTEGTVRTLEYDAEYRLRREVDGLTQRAVGEYAYDAKGNLIRANGAPNQVGPMDDLRSFGGTPLGSDRLGHLTKFPAATGTAQAEATFSVDGRLRAVRVGGAEVQYEYDGLCRRTSASGGGADTRFGWGGGQLLWEDRTATRGPGGRRDYVYLPGIANPIGFLEGGRAYWLHHDARGAVVRATDDAGRVVWRADYNAFGLAKEVVAEVRQPFRLAGQYCDDATGLHYNLVRYYHPKLQTYLSLDPKWQELEATNYSYCRNDPWNRADPNGMFGPLADYRHRGRQSAAVIGGVVGAISAPPGQRFAGFVSGAVGGAIAGAADGAALMLGPVAGAAVSTLGAGLGSAAQDLIMAKMTGQEVCVPCVVTNALVAMGINLAVLGLGAVAARLLPPAAKRAIAKWIAGKIPGPLGRWADATGREVGGEAGGEGSRGAGDEGRPRQGHRPDPVERGERSGRASGASLPLPRSTRTSSVRTEKGKFAGRTAVGRGTPRSANSRKGIIGNRPEVEGRRQRDDGSGRRGLRSGGTIW